MSVVLYDQVAQRSPEIRLDCEQQISSWVPDKVRLAVENVFKSLEVLCYAVQNAYIAFAESIKGVCKFAYGMSFTLYSSASRLQKLVNNLGAIDESPRHTQLHPQSLVLQDASADFEA